MDIDADRLTQVLAGRLAAIVPAGFHVEASDGMLWYSADHGRFPGQRGDYRTGTAGTHVRLNLGAGGQTAGERLVRVAAQALSELQDYVDEATHDPWPGARTPPQAHAQTGTPCCACGTARRAPPARSYSDAIRSRWPTSSPAASHGSPLRILSVSSHEDERGGHGRPAS